MKHNPNPALLAALCGMLLASPTHGGVVGIDANGTDTSPGVLDPQSRQWTAINSSFALDTMNVTSSISGGANGSLAAPLPIFSNYRHNGGNSTITVTLNGLDDSQTYNLAVMMGQNGFGGRGGTATVTTAGASNPPPASTKPALPIDTFVEGAGGNYVLFEGLTTGTTPGQITFTVTNGADGIGIFNGFEIQNIDPNPGIRGPESVSGSCNGEPISLVVNVINTADIDYAVTGTSYAGANAAEFSDTTSTPLTVPAGGSAQIVVDFTPTTGGTATATLALATDDPERPSVDVPLSVAVQDPAVFVSSANLDFGSFIVPPGPTSAVFEIDNFGFTTALTLGNPQITGTGAAAFSVTSLPASIAANDFDEVEVTFDPAVPGVYQAELSLDTNDPFNPTVTVNLSGMVFGGGTPKLQWGFDFTSGTVQSNGSLVLDDSGSNNFGLLLAPGSGVGGTYTADIPTAGSGVGQAQNVTGIGSLDVTGAVGVSTGSGAFSGQSPNGLTAAEIEAAGGLTYEVWVKNVSAGSAARAFLVSLGAMHGIGVQPGIGVHFFYGDNGSVFLAPPTPVDTTEWTHVAGVMVVKPGTGAREFSRIRLYVNGVPVAENPTGRVFPWFLTRGAGIGKHPVVNANPADGLIYEPRITLGTLTPAEFTVVAPAAGIFAPTEVAATTNGGFLPIDIEVENTSAAARALTTPTFSGPGAEFFSVWNFPSMLAPGERAVIEIDFDAQASGGGTFAPTMTIHSDDPVRPAFEVALTVEVFDPGMVLATSSLDFGALTGPGTDTRNILVTNTGENLDLVLSNPQLTGTGASAYNVTLPDPIAPGDSGVIEVTFLLAAIGDFPAELAFDTNDPFNPSATVNLTGEVTALLAGYAAWAELWVDGQAADLDFDHDGIPNGIEFFMGNTTPGFTPNPQPGPGRTITWPKGADYPGTYGTDYHLETSADLATWETVPGDQVTIEDTSISYTLPLEGPVKFARLVVIIP